MNSGVVTAWKRVVLIGGMPGDLRVAGSFARAPVPAEATAQCRNPEVHGPGDAPDPARGCLCGFHAYAQRRHALARRPSWEPIATVELTGLVVTAGPAGEIVVGHRQLVTGLELYPWCVPCAAEEAAVALSPQAVPGSSQELVPVCARHTPAASWTVAEMAAVWPGVHIQPMPEPIARRGLRELVTAGLLDLPRCVCARVERLEVDRGLRHYLRELWGRLERLDGTRLAASCRACGARWIYHRQAWPPYAVQG